MVIGLERKRLALGIVLLACVFAVLFALPQTAHAIESGPAFNGTVIDKGTNAPIAGADVEAYDADGYNYWTYTADDGTYELYAPAGTYELYVYGDQTYEFASLSDVVFNGTTTVTKDFALQRYPLAFKGTVTDKVTGQPMADAMVEACDADGNVHWAYAADDGTYELYAPASTYDIDVYADPTYEPASLSDVVFNGTTTVTKDFALQRYPLAFKGTVTDKVTGRAVAGAQVSVDDGDGNRYGTYTADDGTYEVYAPAGTYGIEAYADSIYEFASLSDVVFNGTTTVTKDFALQRYPLAFKGTVTDKATGQPIADAEVDAFGGDYYYCTSTADDGTYEVYAPAGTYDIAVYVDDTYKPASLSDIVFGGTTTLIKNFALQRYPLAFKGTVTDKATGQPIADVSVSACGGDNYYWTSTADDGTYEVYAPAGTYDIDVDADSCSDTASLSGIVFGGTTTLIKNFALQRYPLAFKGTVTDKATGQPIEGVYILVSLDGRPHEYPYSTNTAADGTYKIYLPAGTYGLFAYTQFGALGYQEETVEDIAFDGSITLTEDFALQREPLAFKGTVTDRVTGQPIAGARLDFQESIMGLQVYGGMHLSGPSSYDVTTAADGTYEFYSPYAVYWVSVYAHGYMNSYCDVSFTGPAATTKDFALEPLATTPATPVTVTPIAGTSRYDTAIKASQDAFADGSAKAVVIARGDVFADALGGSALAGAVKGPLLLTSSSSVPAAVIAELGRLGATKVYVLGGTSAVSAAAYTQLAAFNPERVSGSDRYGTALAVANKTIGILGSSYTGEAFMATGSNFPDALGAAPIAYAKGMPLVLVKADDSYTLPVGVSKVEILGGPVVVSANVQSSLGSKFDGRLAGGNRYATSAAVAAYGVSRGLDWDGVGIATGTDSADALAGGAMLGAENSVMLLTAGTSLSPEAASALTANKAAISDIHFIGGTNAISTACRNSVLAIFK